MKEFIKGNFELALCACLICAWAGLILGLEYGLLQAAIGCVLGFLMMSSVLSYLCRDKK